jgi:spermidine/putrescine transport system ATP-binding protein
MTEYDISLDHITKRFDDVVAVDDVNIDIEHGEFLTLLGPSGCGKTTTLRCIAGFETPTEGNVSISGQRVNNLQPFERDTALVFQSYALFPHMTVGENVAFGLQMQGIPEKQTVADGGATATRSRFITSISNLISREESEEINARVSETLELVDLPGMEDRDIDQLSGGQQQRVALARALVTEPTVLLLDEPLGSLDLKLRKNMQVELKNIQEELETTFIYVTHDQEEALTMSDKIAVMNDGRLEQLGTAGEIYEQPESEFVADFIGETNLVRGTYAEDPEGAIVETDGVEYQVPVTEEAADQVAFAIRPEKIRIGNEASGLANQFQAEIVEEIYKGNLGKFTVRLENGQELNIDRQITDQGKYLSTGSDVNIGWKSENAVVLTR